MTNIKELKKIAMQQERESEVREMQNRPLTNEEQVKKGRKIEDTAQGIIAAINKARIDGGNDRLMIEDIKARNAAKDHLRNQPKEEKQEPAEPKPKKPGILKKLHEFDFSINKENAPKFLPFILYFSSWIVLYIANHHYGEKTLLQIDRMGREMKDLKADYYTSNAELSNKSIQSKVMEMVDSIGLKELRKPPHRLKIIQTTE